VRRIKRKRGGKKERKERKHFACRQMMVVVGCFLLVCFLLLLFVFWLVGCLFVFCLFICCCFFFFAFFFRFVYSKMLANKRGGQLTVVLIDRGQEPTERSGGGAPL